MSNKLQKSKSNGLQGSGKKKIGLAGVNMGTLNQSLNDMTLPRLFYQLVVFVLDGSGSMTFPGKTGKSKGEEVEIAVKDVIKRLQCSKNKNSFDLAFYAYANESVQMLPETSVPNFDFSDNLDPCDYIEFYEQTCLEETLTEVKELTENYINKHNSKNAQALVLILSDGAIHDQEHSEEICREIDGWNNKVKISTILFESKKWQENFDASDLQFLRNNLENLSSGPEFFTSTLDPDQVRKHMIKSISTVSKVD
ncbi:vWA domain-containing protein [uncultured Salegentibacter sp.]|uniref:vWA domain-containing protein n=1 Tax=uncultured Salegentibacter sp. TaxID=259320 RepID=UPI00259850A9|nr:vWA domain-containing protein [uncultured Salegentibacter sp.]